MRIIAIAAVALLLCACGQSASGGGADLKVVNGDFEQAMADGRIPGWQFTQHAGVQAFDVSLDTESPAQGKTSLKLTRTQPQVYGSITQVLPLKGYAGKTVRLTAKMKSAGVGEKGWALLLSARGQRANIYGPLLTGDTPWKDISIEVKVTPEVDQLTIGATLRDAGTGWLDDVQLHVVD